MKIVFNESQITRLKKRLYKENLNEDLLDDLIAKGSTIFKKGVDAAKEFISGLDIDVEKKETDEPTKADFVGDNVDTFFEILESIDGPIVQQKYGSMVRQQAVEAVQIALQILGYELPRFGTDGLFGPETAAAVNKYKMDNNIQDTNDATNNLQESTMIPPIPIQSGKSYRWNEQRAKGPHKGIDIGAPVGTPIKSIADGKVIGAGPLDPDCGDGISIQHADGFISSYCHLSGIKVSNGQTVSQGDIIGLTGGAVGAPGSGNSKGPHLHLTLKKDGQRVNPLEYFGSSIGTFYDSGSGESVIGGAVITVDMVKKLIEDLKFEEITSEDLKKYVDLAVTSGGGPDFTDVDLTDPEQKEIYKKICDNFIRTRNANSEVTGDMMADAAERVFVKYGKYVPPELALAQLALEGGLKKDPNARPIKTKNPFNVGNTDKPYRDNPQPSFEAGVNLYYDLIARRYLVKGKTANDLVNDFRNDIGSHYATAGAYEQGVKSLIRDVKRINSSLYATLNESLLLEADKRQAIKNAIGLNDAWADEFHRMSDKLSVWIASTFIDKLVSDHTRVSNNISVIVPQGEDARTYIINALNTGEPNLENFWDGLYKARYEYIMHWIRAPRREQLNIRDLTFDQAYAQAEEWHDNLQIRKDANYQETGDVFIDYRNSDGVGYYWVNLHKSYCSQEQERMGHCGRASSGSELISLRKINEFGEGESYLTLDYRPGGVIGDFHRHGNKKPTNRFHRQIVDLLINTTYPVTSLTKQGVHRYEDNFHLSDLSPADLRRVYDANPALKYDLNNQDNWPEIINAILSGELDFDRLGPDVKLDLLRTSKTTNKENEFKSKFTRETLAQLVKSVDNLDRNQVTTLVLGFAGELNSMFKEKFDELYQRDRAGSAGSEAKEFFTDHLRAISQDMFHVYENFCDYIDYVFNKLSESDRIEVSASKGIKRTLFSCTNSVPFLARYVDHTRIDMNGNISVKTEQNLWGLVNKDGNVIIMPHYLAVAPNPIDRGKTYMVKHQDGNFYKVDINNDLAMTKLERKR